MITTSQISGYGDMEETNSISIKKGKLLFAAFLFTITAHAQWAIQTAYVNSNIGTGGINFLVTKTINRHELGLGLRLNIYSLAHRDNQNNIFTKRFYPTKFYQNFGFAGFYEYNLFPSLATSRVSVFTDVQLAYGPTRNEWLVLNLNPGVPPNTYSYSVERFGPFLWIENTIGLSLKVPITDKFMLINKAGVGLMSIIGDKLYGKDNTAVLLRNFYDWELTYTVQLGLSYTFGQSE
jgi:hypothetical protein